MKIISIIVGIILYFEVLYFLRFELQIQVGIIRMGIINTGFAEWTFKEILGVITSVFTIVGVFFVGYQAYLSRKQNVQSLKANEDNIRTSKEIAMFEKRLKTLESLTENYNAMIKEIDELWGRINVMNHITFREIFPKLKRMLDPNAKSPFLDSFYELIDEFDIAVKKFNLNEKYILNGGVYHKNKLKLGDISSDFSRQLGEMSTKYDVLIDKDLKVLSLMFNEQIMKGIENDFKEIKQSRENTFNSYYNSHYEIYLFWGQFVGALSGREGAELHINSIKDFKSLSAENVESIKLHDPTFLNSLSAFEKGVSYVQTESMPSKKIEEILEKAYKEMSFYREINGVETQK